MNKIAVKNLRVKYPGAEDYAIRIDELSLGEGLYLLVGRSGSGKSTLGKVLSGIIPHIENAEVLGEVEVNGVDPRRVDVYVLSRTVTYLSQSPYDQTVSGYVEDELALVAENAGVGEERVEEVLKIMGIDNLRRKKVDELSGGQVQKLIIAEVLLLNPAVLILDEPLAHLDPRSGRELLSTLVSLKRGKTIILIEHRLKDLVNHVGEVDKVFLIDRGSLVDVFPGAEMHKRGEVLKKYGLRLPINIELSTMCRRDLKSPHDLSVVEEVIKYVEARGKSETFNREATVEVHGLWFRYTKEYVLKGVELQFSTGRVYAVLGPNASGKSTLLLTIAGVLKPERGEVKLFGKSVRSMRDAAEVVGYVPQNPDLLLMFETVEKEIAERAKRLFKSANEVKRYVKEVAEAFNIGELLNRNPHSLSRGQRFRVALAATVAKRPKVLLLDETTAGQDEENISTLGKFLESYTREGATAVVVTHDVDFALNYADEAVVLYNGEVYAKGPPGEVLADDRIVEKCNLARPMVLEVCKKLGVRPVRDRDVVKMAREVCR